MGPGPDLEFVNGFANLSYPESTLPGVPIEVSARLCNTGDAAPPQDVRVHVYRGTAPLITVQDTVVGVATFAGSLFPPGACREINLTLGLSTTATAERYRFIADPLDVITEGSETNNGTTHFRIGVGSGPDIYVRSLERLYNRNRLDVDALVCNDGDQDSSSFRLTFGHYDLQTFARTWLPFTLVDGVRAGRCVHRFESIQLDAAPAPSLRGGLFVDVDVNGVVPEPNETNNRTYEDPLNWGGDPDVFARIVEATPATEAGYRVVADVCLRSGIPVSNGRLDLIVATTDVVAAMPSATEVLVASRTVSLNGCERVEFVGTWSSVPSGLRYFVVAFDRDGAVVSNDREPSNNQDSRPLLFGAGPNLVVDSITGPESLTAGAAADPTSVRVCNRGTRPSLAGLQGYLTFSALSGTDMRDSVPPTERTDFVLPELRVGECWQGDVATPTHLLAGVERRYRVVVDALAIQTEELYRPDNTAVGPTVRVRSGVDLVIERLETTPYIISGGSTAVTFDACNRGVGSVGSAQVDILYSPRGIPHHPAQYVAGATDGDTVRRSIGVGPLAAGQCQTVHTTGYLAGSEGYLGYHVVAWINADRAVTEGNYRNNYAQTTWRRLAPAPVPRFSLRNASLPTHVAGRTSFQVDLCVDDQDFSSGYVDLLINDQQAPVVTDDFTQGGATDSLRVAATIAAGGCRTVVPSIPATAQTGERYILARLIDDAGILVYEEILGVVVAGTGADLVPSGLTTPPAASNGNGAYSVSVCNDAPPNSSTSEPARVGIWASWDSVVQSTGEDPASHDVLLGSAMVGSLAPQACASVDVIGAVQPSLDGAFFVAAVVNDTRVAVESAYGNNVSAAASVTLRATACGDGVVDPAEGCDDGNALSGDGCSSTCVLEICGDGLVNNAGAESCDDGNQSPGDGCSAACEVEMPARLGEVLFDRAFGQYLSTPVASTSPLNSNAFTFSLWARVPQNQFEAVANRWSEPGQVWWLGHYPYGRIGFGVAQSLTGAGGLGREFATPVTPGEWIHMTVTYDAGTVHLYRNGIADDGVINGPIPTTLTGGDAPLMIGQDIYSGAAGNVAFFDRALTSQEAADVYCTFAVDPTTCSCGTDNHACAVQDVLEMPGLVSYWPLTSGPQDVVGGSDLTETSPPFTYRDRTVAAPPVDGGVGAPDSGPVVDAGASDTGVVPDSGIPDTGVAPDAGLSDTGAAPDAGAIDTGVAPDAGFPDTGVVPDAGFPDSGVPPAPDLVVPSGPEGIEFPPSFLYTTNVHGFRLCNEGNAPLPQAVDVSLFNSAAPPVTAAANLVGSVSVQPSELPAGTCRSFEIVAAGIIVSRPGEYFRLIADPNDVIIESDETNNASLEVPVGGGRDPELVIESVSQLTPATLETRICNRGVREAGIFDIAVSYPGGPLLRQGVTYGLPALSCQTRTLYLPDPSNPIYDAMGARIEVDHRHDVRETNELNNVFMTPPLRTAQPHIWVESISATEVSPGAYRLETSVCHSGAVAGSVPLDFVLSAERVLEAAPQPQELLLASQTLDLSVPCRVYAQDVSLPAPLPSSTMYFGVFVDRSAVVNPSDPNRADNQATTPEYFGSSVDFVLERPSPLASVSRASPESTSFFVCNRGAAQSAPATIDGYWQRSPAARFSDLPSAAVSSLSVPSLASDTCIQLNMPLPMPLATATLLPALDEQYLVVSIDRAGLESREADTSDNQIIIGPVRVRNEGDVELRSISVYQPASGSASATSIICNHGYGGQGALQVRIYGHAAPEYVPGQSFVAASSARSLPFDGDCMGIVLPLGSNVPEGQWYFTAIVEGALGQPPVNDSDPSNDRATTTRSDYFWGTPDYFITSEGYGAPRGLAPQESTCFGVRVCADGSSWPLPSRLQGRLALGPYGQPADPAQMQFVSSPFNVSPSTYGPRCGVAYGCYSSAVPHEARAAWVLVSRPSSTDGTWVEVGAVSVGSAPDLAVNYLSEDPNAPGEFHSSVCNYGSASNGPTPATEAGLYVLPLGYHPASWPALDPASPAELWGVVSVPALQPSTCAALQVVPDRPSTATERSRIVLVANHDHRTAEAAYENNASPPAFVDFPASQCGDGQLETGEACDDGNTTDGDGCSAACIIEVCGDGAVNNGVAETCDDGNTAAGDGCSATCQIEMPARLGEALFDRNFGQELSTAVPSASPLNSNAFTLSMWARVPQNQYAAVANRWSSPGQVWWLGHNPYGRLGFGVAQSLTGAGGVGREFATPVTPGEWMHMIVTYDAGTVHMYRNGVPDDGPINGPIPTTLTGGDAPLIIGQSIYTGAIGNVAYFDRAIGAAEAADVYCTVATDPTTCGCGVDNHACAVQDLLEMPGLVAYWPLTDGPQDVVASFDLAETSPPFTYRDRTVAAPPLDGGVGVPDAGPPADGGVAPVDAGDPDTGVAPDAGFPDSGVAPDAGFPDTGVAPDAGLPDAGVVPDAGFPLDAGFPVDAGQSVDAGFALDAGTTDAGPVVNPTQPRSWTDFDQSLAQSASVPVGAQSPLNPTSAMTFAVWAQFPPQQYAAVAHRWDDGGQVWWLGHYHSGRMSVGIAQSTSGAGGFGGDFATTLVPGSWHHYAFVYDQGQLTLYLDGQDDTQQINGPVPSQLTGGTSPLYVGQDIYTGSAGAAVVYDRALTATEIAQLYCMTGADPRTCDCGAAVCDDSTVLATTPVSYWPMTSGLPDLMSGFDLSENNGPLLYTPAP